MPGGSGHDYASVALAFTKALATRDYPSAYGMTSKQFQTGMSMEEMRAAFGHRSHRLDDRRFDRGWDDDGELARQATV